MGGLGWRDGATACWTGSPQVTRQLDELAILVHEETGKPADDARLEIILAILHIDWAARHAQRVLGPHRVFSGDRRAQSQSRPSSTSRSA